MLKTVAKIRAEWTKNDSARDAGLTTPADIERFDNLPYGPDEAHTLDIYRPKGAGVLPVIISVHGGGYVYGSTKIYQFYCMDLAQRGFGVLSFNYRLAPEHIFPAALQDINRVMLWLEKNAESYGLDRDNIFMLGDSAGAQLASQYAVICTNPAYAEIMEIVPTSLKIKALGLNCGMYDLHSHLADLSEPNHIMPAYFTAHPEDFGEKLDVMKYIDGSYPPAYLISSPGDFLLEQCLPMQRLLQSRGVEAQAKIYGDETTGHVFHVDIRNRLGRQANDDELAFFRKFIK